MIIGDPSIFAIESEMTRAFERLSLRALGLFVVHVGGRRYGEYKPDATMLACSYDEVERRITNRGGHIARFAGESDAGRIADAFRSAIYCDDHYHDYFGIPWREFCDLIRSNQIMWAPDGDSAFDDGSYVLHFDLVDRVRLIAFRCCAHDGLHDPMTLSDVSLASDDFYRILEQWRRAFESEWRIMRKDSDDGATEEKS